MIANAAGTFSTQVELYIRAACEPEEACGTFRAPQLPCSGSLLLKEISGSTFEFLEQDVSGAATCATGGVEYLQLQEDGTLLYEFAPGPGTAKISSGVLNRP